MSDYQSFMILHFYIFSQTSTIDNSLKTSTDRFREYTFPPLLSDANVKQVLEMCNKKVKKSQNPPKTAPNPLKIPKISYLCMRLTFV